MRNTAFILVIMVSLVCGMAGCREKPHEEQIAALVARLDRATEEEAGEILAKIVELSELQRADQLPLWFTSEQEHDVDETLAPPIPRELVTSDFHISDSYILGVYDSGGHYYLKELVSYGVQRIEVKAGGVLILSTQAGDRQWDGKWKPVLPHIGFAFSTRTRYRPLKEKEWRIRDEDHYFKGEIQKDAIAQMDLREVKRALSPDIENRDIDDTWRRHNKAIAITVFDRESILWSRYTNPDAYADILIRGDGTFVLFNSGTYTVEGDYVIARDQQNKLLDVKLKVAEETLTLVLADDAAEGVEVVPWIKQDGASMLRKSATGVVWDRYHLEADSIAKWIMVLNLDGTCRVYSIQGEWTLTPRFIFQVGDAQVEAQLREWRGRRVLDVGGTRWSRQENE